ncbi:MAG: hypothetical protein GAK43_02137 [Stenotrophomonas maltophilia]|nr:MAG: hypothetical protein GAK43_02137 [Stenotrophomonas maltophilia]
MLLLDRKVLLAIPPLWRLGFRPFFLAGSAYALLAVVLWTAALAGLLPGWQPLGGWMAWHRHEMLFGFALAIIAGFLMTAVQNWTGQPGLSGRPLAILALLWLLARAAWLLAAPGWLVLLLELGFIGGVCLAVGRSLWRVKQVRNYPVLLVLALFGVADAYSLAGTLLGHESWARGGCLAALWLVTAMLTLIGGRVIPFFTFRGVGLSAQVPAWVRMDHALLVGTLLLAVIVALLPAPGKWLAGLYALLALGHLIRSVRWYHPGIWKVPLLWSLHLGYAWIGVGLLGLALSAAGAPWPSSLPLQALTVGGIGGAILAMIARVSLGHTGRALAPPPRMGWAFALLNLGVVARVFVAGVWLIPGVWLATLCWSVAFGLFLSAYAAMFWQPRLDGQPG